MTPERTGPLAVLLTCDRATTGARGHATCTIEIANAGTAPLRLNQRLLVAYEPILDRDLYFAIEKDGAPYVGTDEYDRSSSAEELEARFYREVAPGEKLTKRVDLYDYYRFRPGTYRLRAVYAPQPSDAGKDAWAGTARSNEVTLTVK